MDRWRNLKRWQRWTLVGVGAFVLIGVIGTVTEDDQPEEEPAAAAIEATQPAPDATAGQVTEPTAPLPTVTTLPPTPTTTTTTVPPTTTTTTTTTTVPPFVFEASGRGDDVVEVSIPLGEPAIVTLTHDGTSNFAVINHTASAERLDLLVNEIGKYQGTRPIQFETDSDVGLLEITANGNWEITIQPLRKARNVSCTTGTAVGTGDDVIVLADFSDRGGAASITHNGDSNFSIWAWGDGRDLLVNEIGEYDGTVLVGSQFFVWDITADGDWTITC